MTTYSSPPSCLMSRTLNGPPPGLPKRSSKSRYCLVSRSMPPFRGPGLRLAHRVTQVRDADARYHLRVAEEGGRAFEAFEESDSRAEQHRRDVNVDLVEESGVQ